jgi:rhodanese-related sulfurtransferase
MTSALSRRSSFPRALALGVAGSFLAVVGCDKNITDNDIKFVSISELKVLVDAGATKPKSLLLIDPRSESSYLGKRMPGAVNILLPQIDPEGDGDPALEAYSNLIVYGENPASAPARAMTKRLLSAGFDDVRMFAGGLEEWSDADFPTESGPSKNAISLRRRRQ